ncbi:MAG TPA: phage minor head protein [Chitinophagaceae bacterium]|nr:phage minor head protein [Chitinophagaceae bacterium]
MTGPKQHMKIQASVENKYLAKIYSSLNKQTKAATDYLKQYGAAALRADLDKVIPYEPLLSVISALYQDGGLRLAKITFEALPDPEAEEKARGQMGMSASWLQKIKGYFRTFLLNKAVLPITDTTKKHIRGVLDQANEEGWGVDKTVREIGDKEISRKRAEVITRTESVRATNLGAMLGAAARGLKLVKRWIAVNDHKTRPDHKYLGGQEVDFEVQFTTPEGFKLMYPGDPNAPAKEVIQCRCVLGFIPQRDKRGRLIRANYEGLIA